MKNVLFINIGDIDRCTKWGLERKMKFLLFGTGDYYERYKKWFPYDDVVALIDNSIEKHNTIIDGHLVVSPKEAVKLRFDVIVILSFYIKEMKKQLVELGITESVIYHFYDLHSLIYNQSVKRPIMYYGDAGKILENNINKKRVLLLSQDLTLGGPAIALFHIAEVLTKNNYEIVYGSMIDGPLREKILSAGISVIVDENLQIETMSEAQWTQNFSLILCSTINFHVFLLNRDTRIPFIWWLHDSEFFYDGINENILKELDLTNLKVVSVGPVPRKAMKKYLPKLEIGDLLYGVTDTFTESDNVGKSDSKVQYIKREEGKVYFATIGYIEGRKGQDILVSAIKMLPKNLREQTVFYLIGQNTSIMAENIKNEIKNMPEIVMTGTVGRSEIDGILFETDMLVCPSREDPMPTVAAEAMMHGVPCLLSDSTGTADYIMDGINGLLFENENVVDLYKKLKWCIENKNKLEQLGKQARKIYDNIFSMEAFEDKLLNLFDNNEI